MQQDRKELFKRYRDSKPGPDAVQIRKPHMLIRKYKTEVIEGGAVVKKYYEPLLPSTKKGKMFLYQIIRDTLGVVQSREWFDLSPFIKILPTIWATNKNDDKKEIKPQEVVKAVIA